MSKEKWKFPTSDALFERVVSILEEARGNVVRAVNTSMVTAYWLIGREIVQEIQGGEERAEYGKQIIDNLSAQLTARYGKGFSTTNLKYFRLFYHAYPDRLAGIRHPAGDELAVDAKPHSSGGESTAMEKRYPVGSELPTGFSPRLSWSHYRALMRVEDSSAHAFYEKEADECGWSKAQLERQIQSSYFQRIIANRGEAGLVSQERERLPVEPMNAGEVLKSPYVLEFL
ncbi:MAG: DUF1016 domain-containing protein, partial [Planctomycetes bacterium]|nr:DUF1016 domain-containing protein [Planctomycetota bacterium]